MVFSTGLWRRMDTSIPHRHQRNAPGYGSRRGLKQITSKVQQSLPLVHTEFLLLVRHDHEERFSFGLGGVQ